MRGPIASAMVYFRLIRGNAKLYQDAYFRGSRTGRENAWDVTARTTYSARHE